MVARHRAAAGHIRKTANWLSGEGLQNPQVCAIINTVGSEYIPDPRTLRRWLA